MPAPSWKRGTDQSPGRASPWPPHPSKEKVFADGQPDSPVAHAHLTRDVPNGLARIGFDNPLSILNEGGVHDQSGSLFGLPPIAKGFLIFLRFIEVVVCLLDTDRSIIKKLAIAHEGTFRRASSAPTTALKHQIKSYAAFGELFSHSSFKNF